MSSFIPKVKPSTTAPDPSKHVNYNFGMVLGVDDFTQEFAYLSGRNQWMAHDLIGYGTVSGLSINLDLPEVVVNPGVALSPAGQLIRVPKPQCARIDEWLSRNLESPPLNGSVSLYVVLCYRECPTDMAPIPGEPCRTEEETMAPSRIADDFKLELRFDPPSQCEEDALRGFVEWLSRSLEVTDIGIDFISMEDFLQAIRDAVNPITSPPCSTPFFTFESPQVALRVRSSDACEFLRAAFRLWVTELRPRWQSDFWSRWRGCSGGSSTEESPREEECLMLAEIIVPYVAGAIDSAGITINEERRPFLLHLRMIQEWLLCGRTERVEIGDLALNDLIDVEAPAPLNGDALIFQGGVWVAAPPAGGVTDHGALTGLGDNDHPQYLLRSGANSMTGNLNVGNNRVTNMAPGAAAGDAVAFQQAIKNGDPAQGDLSGNYPAVLVDGLQGRAVSNAAPDGNDLLRWNAASNRWEPAPLLPILPFVTITPGDNGVFQLWFHIDVPRNRAEIPNLTTLMITVSAETTTAPNFLTVLNIINITRQTRNLFQFTVQNIPAANPLLRFDFSVSDILVSVQGTPGTSTLNEYMRANAFDFIGHNGRSITAFSRGFVRGQINLAAPSGGGRAPAKAGSRKKKA